MRYVVIINQMPSHELCALTVEQGKVTRASFGNRELEPLVYLVREEAQVVADVLNTSNQTNVWTHSIKEVAE